MPIDTSMNKRKYLLRRCHSDAPVEMPVGVIDGNSPGPIFTVVAGVHGAEYAPIAASHQLFREISPEVVKGQVRFAFIANLPAFRSRKLFLNPIDGKNLNRSFPGNSQGSHTEALANLISEEIIKGSDYLVDLHSGDLIEDLVPFVIVNPTSDKEAWGKRVALAACYPTDYVLAPSPDRGGWSSAGTTFSCAESYGAVSCMVEAGGKGQLDQGCVSLMVRGTLNAMRWAGVLNTETMGATPGLVESAGILENTYAREAGEPRNGCRKVQQRLAGLYPVTSKCGGFFLPAVKVGQTVEAGDILGTVYDCFGEAVEHARAEKDGIAILVASSPVVEEGGTLVSIGVHG